MTKIHIIGAGHGLKPADSVHEKRKTFVYNTSSLAIKRKTSRDATRDYSGIVPDTFSDTVSVGHSLKPTDCVHARRKPLAYKASSLAIKRKMSRDAAENYSDTISNTSSDALLEILKSKNITLAAAVTGKELAGEFAALLPLGIFHNLLNAGPLAVREMALEVPRSCLYENEGINRKAAMYMAHNIIALCNTAAGFALVMQPQAPQAYIALAATDRVACLEIDLPAGLSEREAIGLIGKHVLRFCEVSLQAYPDDIPNAVSATEFLAESEETPAVLKLLWPRRRHAIT